MFVAATERAHREDERHRLHATKFEDSLRERRRRETGGQAIALVLCVLIGIAFIGLVVDVTSTNNAAASHPPSPAPLMPPPAPPSSPPTPPTPPPPSPPLASQPGEWRFGADAVSCTTVCGDVGLTCNAAALAEVTSAETYLLVAASASNPPVAGAAAWSTPGGHSIPALAPFLQPVAFANYIFLSTGTPTCTAASAQRTRLCACGTMSPPPPSLPPAAP